MITDSRMFMMLMLHCKVDKWYSLGPVRADYEKTNGREIEKNSYSAILSRNVMQQ